MSTNHLQQTMENFYLCTYLPIRAFNQDLVEMLSTGFLPGMPTYEQEVKDWLESQTNLCTPMLTFSPQEHIYFTLCILKPVNSLTLSAFPQHKGFFLIGPYTDDLSFKDDFAFKPKHCIPYLIELLYTIGEDTTASVALDSYNYHTIRAQKYIKEHYTEPITLDILAHHLQLNKSYLCTIFKKATKDSFCMYTNKVRIEQSKKLLQCTNQSITDIALSVGFSSSSYFDTTFKKLEGKTPMDYRKAFIPRHA